MHDFERESSERTDPPGTPDDWAVPPPQPPAPPHAQAIAFDLECRGCGFNLRTLTLADQCPGCGFRVASSVPLAMLPPPAVDDALRLYAPPRVWTALLAVVIAVPVAVGIGIFVAIFARIASLGVQPTSDEIDAWVQTFHLTPVGFLTVILPYQLTFAAAAILPALLSPRPFTERLALTRGGMPVWTWLVFILAVPFVQFVIDEATQGLFPEPSEHLMQIVEMVRGFDATFFIVAAVAISVLPGVGEEVLFRGYLQSRLLKRWHPVAAIGVSSILFALAHIDPMHILMVLPIGVWLGVIAWRAGSIWPAILCHTANNLLSVAMMRTLPADTQSLELTGALIAVLAVSTIAFIASIILMVIYPRKTAA